MFEKAIGTINAAASFRHRYDNFIGGRWSAPAGGEYFADTSPINGAQIAEFALSTPEDVERARILNRVADRLEDNLELLALAVVDRLGKRQQLQIILEPVGVVGQIIPWNFPLLMAAWKIAPALAAGNCTVIKPASQTPLTLLMFAELTADILPPGVLNVVTGPGRTVGQAVAANPRIAKVSFTGETVTGKQIMHAAADHLIPQTMELGGKSPNIFMADVLDEDDAFFDKALEGFTLFAFNKGEVCTCPSRALIHESIFDRFIERAVARIAAIRQGDPLDPSVQVGAQASEDQLHKILGYIDIGKAEGAQCLVGGARALPGGALDQGYFVQPTVFVGQNHMRIFQEEIFGPVLSVTTFKTVEEAIALANDTAYGLGAGVWTRSGNTAYRLGRAIEAGRVWTNCYHQYPAHAAFGGYKASGFGRENHRMMLDHYQQTKNLLVSYDEHALGLF